MVLSICATTRKPTSLSIAKARTAVGGPIFDALKIDKLFQYCFCEKFFRILTGVPLEAHAFAIEAIANINAQTTNNVQVNNFAMIVIVVD